MSDLIAIGFKDKFTADAVLLDLRKLELEHLIDLEEAAIVIRDRQGHVKIEQAQELVASDAPTEGYWGLLLGVIQPILDVFDRASGTASVALTCIGLDDNFIRDIGNTIQPGTSAIFVMVKKYTPDDLRHCKVDLVLADLSKFEGKVLRTSLSRADEIKLQDALMNRQVR